MNNTKCWDKYNFNKDTIDLIKETEYIYNEICIPEMEYYGEEPFYLSDWIEEYLKDEAKPSIPEEQLFLTALSTIRKILSKLIT